MARKFSGTVKEILGTCHSVGCTVNGQPAPEIVRQINAGEIDVPDQ